VLGEEIGEALVPKVSAAPSVVGGKPQEATSALDEIRKPIRFLKLIIKPDLAEF
jgi:hypothetical protein